MYIHIETGLTYKKLTSYSIIIIIIGGAQYPAALTHPTTVTWLLLSLSTQQGFLAVHAAYITTNFNGEDHNYSSNG